MTLPQTRRTDGVFFDILAGKFRELSTLEEFCFVNFFNNPQYYVKDLVDSEFPEARHREFIKHKEAFRYWVHHSVSHLQLLADKNHCSPRQLVVPNGTALPSLLLEGLAYRIMPEFLVILHKKTDLFEYWDSVLVHDTVFWPSFRARCLKYESFLDRKIAEMTDSEFLSNTVKIFK